MGQEPEKCGDLEVLSWIIRELYSGGRWLCMETERPEINDVCDRLDVWAEEE